MMLAAFPLSILDFEISNPTFNKLKQLGRCNFGSICKQELGPNTLKQGGTIFNPFWVKTMQPWIHIFSGLKHKS
jgi:hypothetical protein